MNGRVWVARALVALATILSVAALLAVWANRQVLNADRWSDTSTALLANDAIRTEVADYVADQVYDNLVLAGPLKTVLQGRLEAIAGAVTGGLRPLLRKAAFDLLGTPGAQSVWKATQKLAAQHFLEIVEGNSRLVQLNGNTVYVDLRPIAVDLAEQLGLPSSALGAIPSEAGRLRIVSSNQIPVVRQAIDLIRGLAIVLPIAAVLLFAVALWLGRGRRLHVLALIGSGLIVSGVIVLIAREIAGTQIVNSLVATVSVRPAAHAAWSITTAMLRDLAWATVGVGLVVAAASLGEAARRARRSR